MTLHPLVLALGISLAGGVGAVLRHLTTVLVSSRTRSGYPWGTTVVNFTGSFVIGLVAGPLVHERWGAVITIGLLGGFTTFSSTSLETIELWEARWFIRAATNALGMLIGCTALALFGLYLTA